jgi:phage FluMu protein Com
MTYKIELNKNFQCLVCGEPNAHISGYELGDRNGASIETKCPDCKAIGKISNMEPWYGRELKETEALSIMELAGIKTIGKPYKLMNAYHSGGGNKQYWHPWWLIKIEIGFICIGWRKRVIEISWTETPIRAIVTKDELTKDLDFVHAYSVAKAVEYMTEWNRIAKNIPVSVPWIA